MSEASTKQSIEAAWAKAADCASLRDEATTPDMKVMYGSLRNSWIQIANNLQAIENAADLPGNGQLKSLLEPGIDGQPQVIVASDITRRPDD